MDYKIREYKMEEKSIKELHIEKHGICIQYVVSEQSVLLCCKIETQVISYLLFDAVAKLLNYTVSLA